MKDRKTKLIAIGGALVLEENNPIVKEFVDGVKTRGGEMILIPSYKEDEEKLREVERMHIGFFLGLGIKRIEYWMPEKGRFNNQVVKAKHIASAGGLFISGGKQSELMEMMEELDCLDELKARYFSGEMVVAGTSAGCAVMSEVIIMKGLGDPEMGRGLGLLKEVITDQHFSSGNANFRYPRLERLVKAVMDNPQLVGMGVDENTGVVVEENSKCRVIGEGGVTLVDARGVKDGDRNEEIEELKKKGLRIRILNSGEEFELS